VTRLVLEGSWAPPPDRFLTVHGARIKVTNPARIGSEVVLTIVGMCTGCGHEQIDMSISAFDLIGPLGAGEMAVEHERMNSKHWDQ